MATTGPNYTQAWRLLEETYANERLIVTRHVDLLVQTAPVAKETAATLREFVNHVQQHLRSLKTLEVPVEHWDTLLLSILLPKLTQQIRLTFDHTLKDNELPKIEGLMKFLTQRARSLETTSVASDPALTASPTKKKLSSPTLSRRQFPKPRNSSPNKPSKVFSTNTKSLKTECSYCKRSGHYISRCEGFHALPVNQRIQSVKRASLCSNCLRQGHTSEQCNASGCRICDENHNTLLHVPRTPRGSPSRRSTDNAREASTSPA
nr:uncharacterized protein LOC117227700 [Megalopta genalis]